MPDVLNSRLLHRQKRDTYPLWLPPPPPWRGPPPDWNSFRLRPCVALVDFCSQNHTLHNSASKLCFIWHTEKSDFTNLQSLSHTQLMKHSAQLYILTHHMTTSSLQETRYHSPVVVLLCIFQQNIQLVDCHSLQEDHTSEYQYIADQFNLPHQYKLCSKGHTLKPLNNTGSVVNLHRTML